MFHEDVGTSQSREVCPSLLMLRSSFVLIDREMQKCATVKTPGHLVGMVKTLIRI